MSRWKPILVRTCELSAGRTGLSKRWLVLLIISVIFALLVILGLAYWFSEMIAEKRLQGYLERLEKVDFAVEEHPLSSLRVDDPVRIHFFGDFRSFAMQEGIDRIYLDRGIHALYFSHPTPSDGKEVNAFYYK